MYMKQLFLFFGESISSLEVRPQGVPTFQQSFQLEGKKRGMGALGNRSRPHRQMTVGLVSYTSCKSWLLKSPLISPRLLKSSLSLLSPYNINDWDSFQTKSFPQSLVFSLSTNEPLWSLEKRDSRAPQKKVKLTSSEII